ncbi:MAG: serine/threonine protein kinase [Sandaracinaceae bacterium]|nr:serine/threonine protein kinase [Sandaracinaceae bacterium]
MIDVGDTLGEFRVVSRLSEGGMATLFLGQRVGAAPTDPPVAIKVIHDTYSDDWQFVRMFIDEALISVRIRHPNVVRVEELGEKDDRYYLVMEYVHGCSLAHLLRALGRQGRRMRPEIAVWIASEVAAGLHAAHDMTGEGGELLNVIHRDVSPQNILLSIDGHVKLLDFGIAKAAGRAERTEAGVIKGKVRYMAPEQAKGEPLDRRVDVFALAVVLWEMLTMRRFIEGKSELELIRKVRSPEAVAPSARVAGIDPRTDAAVLAALAADRDARPPTAAHFRALLDAAVPPGTIGPAHVAELLRVFLGDELERSFASIPAALVAAIAEGSGEARPLPGEDASTARAMALEERSRVLTVPELAATVDDLEVPDEEEEPPTRRLRSEEGPSERAPKTMPQAPAFDPSAFAEYGDQDEDETLRADAEELRQLGLDMQRDVRASAPRPPPPPRRPPPPRPPAPAANATLRAPPRAPEPSAAVPAPAPPRRARGSWAWAAGLVALTFAAFAIGAGIAIAWVHLR